MILSHERMVVCDDFHNHPASVLSLNGANVYRLEVTCQKEKKIYKTRHRAMGVAGLMGYCCEIL